MRSVSVLMLFVLTTLLFPRSGAAAQNKVSIFQDNQYRYIESNGTPHHDW